MIVISCIQVKNSTIESVMSHEVKLLLAQCLGSSKRFINEGKTELIIFRSPWKQLPCDLDIRADNYKLTFYQFVK